MSIESSQYVLRAMFAPSPANPLPRDLAHAIPDTWLNQLVSVPPNGWTVEDWRRVIEQSIRIGMQELSRSV